MFNLESSRRLSLFVVIGCALVSHVAASGCTITLPTDLPQYEPVMLTSLKGAAGYQLFKPTGQTTTLPIGAKLLLDCPGRGNAILLGNLPSLELICSAGNVFKTAAGKQQTLKQLGCKAIPTSVLKLTTEPCAGGQGHVFEAGFEVQKTDFASVFSICYDNATENTFWTHNTLNGAAITFSTTESTRRAFRAEGMKYTTAATNRFYTTNGQIARFEKDFGASQPYITSTMFMARGHLTPDNDMIFSYEQLATYFYTNCAPEFQIVNAGNWIRVENLARSLAANFGEDLDIWNGYMGTLTLPRTTAPRTKIPIFLDEKNQIEAPLYYFKVIRHEPSDAAIVMITQNNPFAGPADIDEFCPNVCDRAGLNSPFYTDASRGYTFCCELAAFKKHYADLPSSVTATSLLGENVV